MKYPFSSHTRKRVSYPVALLAVAAIAYLAQTAVADPSDDAMAKACRYLMAQQDEQGGISQREKDRGGRHITAMTSLSLLAFAAVGTQPGDESPEGKSMRNALNFVLRPENQEPDGYFGAKDGSRMYGHGVVTLMLAEMLGMGTDVAQDELIRIKCRKALDLILRAQKVPKSEPNRGGWRYQPDSGDSDMSVTVWQTMALRSAKNAGLDIPKESIDDAVRYIKRAYSPDGGVRRGLSTSGGFGYMGPGREPSTTAEGLLALQVCGEYESEEVKGAAERLFKEGGIRQGERWYYYLSYYYAQGMYQRGGKYAEEARKNIIDALLPLQAGDGSWDGNAGEEKQGGKIYATSLAVLSLAVKNHYLPIYQR